MFIPGCILAIAVFIFSGSPHKSDPALSQAMDQDHARILNNR